MKTTNTKEKLLEATLRLISEKGYLGATTREIAHQAGVTELTLFRNFTTKENLVESMLKRYTFLPKLRELLPQFDHTSYEESLRIIGLRFLETLTENKSLVKIMLSEMHSYPEKIRAIYHNFIGELILTLAGHLVTLQKRSILRRFPPEIAARVFLGMIFSYFRVEEILQRRSIPKAEQTKMIRAFVDLFVHGTLK
jgi:AcrR family transcriptional regulator